MFHIEWYWKESRVLDYCRKFWVGKNCSLKCNICGRSGNKFVITSFEDRLNKLWKDHLSLIRPIQTHTCGSYSVQHIFMSALCLHGHVNVTLRKSQRWPLYSKTVYVLEFSLSWWAVHITRYFRQLTLGGHYSSYWLRNSYIDVSLATDLSYYNPGYPNGTSKREGHGVTNQPYRRVQISRWLVPWRSRHKLMTISTVNMSVSSTTT